MAAQEKRGRPSGYTQELADLICLLLSEGQSLRKICALEDMPSQSMIYRWLIDNKDFREQYTRAREEQAEFYADELIGIADDDSKDVSGELQMPNSVAVQRSRLQVDTRKWLLSKLLPKKYGDKIEHTGPEGGPIQAAVTVHFVGSTPNVTS